MYHSSPNWILPLLAALLFALAPSAVAQSSTDCPNTVQIAGECETFVAPGRGEAFVAGEPLSAGPSVLYAPSEGDDPVFRTDLSTALGGATVDYYDARSATPTVGELSAYDAVVTWANYAYSDKEAFGDNLATYADGGGTVIMGAFTTFDVGNALGGAIRGSSYSPVSNPTGTNHATFDYWADDGSLFYGGVTTLGCGHRGIVDLHGAGMEDGTFVGDGETLAAYRPDIGVLFMNGGSDPALSCSGEWTQLAANMILYSTGGATPNVDIEHITCTCTPERGDWVFFRAWLMNHEAFTVRTRIHYLIEYPNGVTRHHSVLSKDVPGGFVGQIQHFRRMKFFLPDDAPEGTYTVTMYASADIADGGAIYDSDSFTFELPPLPPSMAKAGDDAALAGVAESGPNPFSQSTTIRYVLTDDVEVDLRVFDVTGREVATLASGAQMAGAHAARFDAGVLPNGMYLWRLTVAGEVTVGQLTLAR